MLTFPPHTSDKLQPLDISVFHLFKHYYNRSLDAWHFNNPGKVFNIYDVAQAVGEAFPKAFTPLNTMSGFRALGIHPFNRDCFTDADFVFLHA